MRYFARILAEELHAIQTVGNFGDLVDQHESPLGNRRHCRLIREGKIPGGRAGRRWLASREAIEDFMSAEAERDAAKAKKEGKKTTTKPKPPANDVDTLASELGFARVEGE